MSKLTKQAIYASFLKFLEEKPLDQITVKDIVDDCGINRKTFYYYFQDIYALTEEIFRSELDRIRREHPPTGQDWQEIFREIADYLYRNRRIALHVFRSVGYEEMSDVFFKTSMEYMPDYLRRLSAGRSVREEDLDLLARYTSLGISGLLARWMAGGMPAPPLERMERLAEIMDGTIELALQNAERLPQGGGAARL